ncbi:glycosyltransferase family 2 protein [Streptomyces sp. P1-3]|uniref:glycosyltransferase family 2 protein n=1 Tax=Streptomyces sp. P1-3 TaxID=3421658 RepID=UPI003D365424
MRDALTLLDGLRAHGNDYSAVERAFGDRTGLELTGAGTGALDEVREPVSVVVATYDGRRALAGALAGLQEQTYRGFEVVVVDDGSDPPVERTVREAALTVPVTLVRCHANRGAATARNIGLLMAEGSTVVFLDDDMRAPPHTTGLLAVRQQHTDGCLFTGFRENTGPETFFGPQPRAARIERDWRWSSDRGGDRHLLLTADRSVPYPDRLSYQLVRESRFFKEFGHCRAIGFWDLPGMVVGHSVCVKRADALAAGGFPEEHFRGWGAEDLAFGAVMAARGHSVVPALDWVSFHLRHAGRHEPRAAQRASLERNFARYLEFLRLPLDALRPPRHRVRRLGGPGAGGISRYEAL